MTATPNRDEKILLSSEPKGGDDVGHTGALGDVLRAAVDGPVPHGSGLVVIRFIRCRNTTGEFWNLHCPPPQLSTYPTIRQTEDPVKNRKWTRRW